MENSNEPTNNNNNYNTNLKAHKFSILYWLLVSCAWILLFHRIVIVVWPKFNLIGVCAESGENVCTNYELNEKRRAHIAHIT